MSMKAPRIFLIHTTALAIDPITAAFARQWPQAQIINLLEDSLPRDRVEEGELTASMKARFLQARSGLPVLTTPDNAVLELRRMLQADDFISSQDGCLPNA
jgi:hypothetical protein